MTRKEFLTELDHRLSSLPRQEAEEHLNYYAEMLADRVEVGMSEEEAVSSMESVDTIAARILGASYTEPTRAHRNRRNLVIAASAVGAAVVAVVAAIAVPYFAYKNTATHTPSTTPIVDSSSTNTNQAADHAPISTVPSSATESIKSIDAENIRNLRIEWTSESVCFELWEEDTIQLEERGAALAMICRVEGDTLYVKRDTAEQLSSASNGSDLVVNEDGVSLGGLVINEDGVSWNGAVIDDSGINFSNDQSSRLVVTLPRSLVEGSLDSITISVVSAEVDMSGVNAKELSLTSISGTCSVDGHFDELTVSTTSGEAFFTGSFAEGMFNTVSGGMYITADAALRSLDANSVSGEISLSIPADTGFTLEFDTVSGGFYSGNFSVRESGKKYTCGDGSVDLRVDTVSGDLVLLDC